MRILLVEDDEALCAAVAPLLEQEGYRVDVCRDGDDALYYMRQRMFGLCILDRMLPGRDGLSVLRAARAEGLDTPVLMTTALGLVGDRVDGLDAGADDYLVKPFDVRELLARVRALARRPAPVAVSGRPCCGDLTLDMGTLVLTGDKEQCTLSKKEAELLAALMENAGQTLSRSFLFGRVWGPKLLVTALEGTPFISTAQPRASSTSSSGTRHSQPPPSPLPRRRPNHRARSAARANAAANRGSKAWLMKERS